MDSSKPEYESIICRICLSDIKPREDFLFVNHYAKTSNFENMLISKLIERSVSEMVKKTTALKNREQNSFNAVFGGQPDLDIRYKISKDLDICDSPAICMACYALVVNAYVFKSKCYSTEQKIYLYMEKNGFQIGDKINLKDVIEADRLQNEQENSTNTEEVISLVKSEKDEDIIVIPDSNSDNEESDHHPDDNEKIEASRRKRPYSCDKCEYKTYRYNLLKKHLRGCKGGNIEEMFNCDKCAYSTCRKRNLKRHMLTHGGDRPYTCGICNKGFTEKCHIKSHMYKHTGTPLPYKCGEEGCASNFARKCDLNAHILKHVKYKPYTCTSCKKSFLTEEQFTKHTKRHKLKDLKNSSVASKVNKTVTV